MTLALLIRRNLVIVGVVGALVLGGATVRAAALWTAAAAPLEQPPAALAAIKDSLAQERARSAELEAQLTDLTTASDELARALQAARDQVTTDAMTADGLRASLAAAQAKLTKLEAALRTAQSVRTTTSANTATAPAARGGEPDDDEEHDDD